MTLRKLTFCILCFVNVANLATEEDFNDEKSSNSKVEENVLINKNNWNTRKWGSIYVLLPGMHPMIIVGLFFPVLYLFTSSVEYKYIFPIKIGFSIRAALGNPRFFICLRKNKINGKDSDISLNLIATYLIFSVCWIYEKKGKKILSGSFSPIGFGVAQEINFKEFKKNKGDPIKYSNFCKDYFFLNLTFLNYENGKGFYLSWGHFDIQYSQFKLGRFFLSLFFSILHLELGFNISKLSNRKKY